MTISAELRESLIQAAHRVATEGGKPDHVFHQGQHYQSDREARRVARNKRKAAARKAKR